MPCDRRCQAPQHAHTRARSLHPACQATAARASLEGKLAASRSEAAALSAQLAESRGALDVARTGAAAAEATAARLHEERVRLSKV
jgi:hypothetical protein